VGSDNLFDDIAQKLQRKGLLIHFHRRIHAVYFVQTACICIEMGHLLGELLIYFYLFLLRLRGKGHGVAEVRIFRKEVI
jgi:hypothetical protein